MKIHFACPSCAASGSIDAEHVGKQVRCKHCKYRFTIPSPDAPDDDGYSLVAPDHQTESTRSQFEMPGEMDAPVFVPNRGDDPTDSAPPRKKRRPKSGSHPLQRSHTLSLPFPVPRMLIQGGIVTAIALTGISIFAPNGLVITASILLAVGTLMVLAGYIVGAFSAFREDSLYGFLYVIFPLYTAYYLISRWDDFWVWVVCSTAGFLLILLGTELLRWHGIPV